MTQGPVLFDLDDADSARPEAAPVVLDAPEAPQGQAMQKVAAMATARPSRLARWFLGTLLSLTGFIVSLAALEYITGLLARSPILGLIALGLTAVLLLLLAIISLRELAAFSRLRKLDHIQQSAKDAHASDQRTDAMAVIAQLDRLYAAREDTAWGRATLKEQQGDILDASGLLGLAETSLMVPLDAQAQRAVEAADRRASCRERV